MKFILQLKHWQLFLILLFLHLFGTRPGDGGVIAGLMFSLVFFTWIWSLSVFSRRLPAAKSVALKSTGLLAFNFTYLCLFVILLAIFQMQHYYIPDVPRLEKALWRLGGFYAIFALLHTTWSTARTLSMMGNVGGYFWGTAVVYALFLLFPIIGVWAIQPIVNMRTPEPPVS